MATNSQRPFWRRYLQFRLSTLFLVTLLVCLWGPVIASTWKRAFPPSPQELPDAWSWKRNIVYPIPDIDFKLHREATKMKQLRVTQDLIDVGN